MIKRYDKYGNLIEIRKDGNTVWSREDELKKAQDEIIDKLKQKGKLKDKEAKEIKDELKGGN